MLRGSAGWDGPMRAKHTALAPIDPASPRPPPVLYNGTHAAVSHRVTVVPPPADSKSKSPAGERKRAGRGPARRKSGPGAGSRCEMEVVDGSFVIKGLADAVLLLDLGLVHVDAVVESVEIRQAPALLQLITTATGKWNVARDQKLRHLARVSCEADILLDVVLPLLKADPRSAAGGRLLTRYGWSLRRLGRKVDGVNGAFFAVAVADSNFLRRHASHLNRGTKGVKWLTDNIAAIEKRLVDLKGTVVNIPAVAKQDEDEDAGVDDEKTDGGDSDEADGGGESE